jgi:hypothetical protein
MERYLLEVNVVTTVHQNSPATSNGILSLRIRRMDIIGRTFWQVDRMQFQI